MEFTRLYVLALICLAVVGSDASQSGEDYWHSVWPNTPLPKTLSDLLMPYSEIPIKAKEEKQYWSVFFEHDLYPGKQMSLGVHEHSDILHQHFQPKFTKEVSRPFGVVIWDTAEKVVHEHSDILHQHFQPKFTKEVSRPFGVVIWDTAEKVAQPEKENIDHYCVRPSAIGEEKYCTDSLKSMMDFAISKLGTNIKVISSSFNQNNDQYVVEEVNKIGDKAVMCHRLNFEKVVFYCHQVNATTTYMVPLVASDGIKAEALTICHHDTRGMNPDVLYNVLKVKPGTIPVCHFVGNKAIAWVPNRDASRESIDHPCVI